MTWRNSLTLASPRNGAWLDKGSPARPRRQGSRAGRIPTGVDENLSRDDDELFSLAQPRTDGQRFPHLRRCSTSDEGHITCRRREYRRTVHVTDAALPRIVQPPSDSHTRTYPGRRTPREERYSPRARVHSSLQSRSEIFLYKERKLTVKADTCATAKRVYLKSTYRLAGVLNWFVPTVCAGRRIPTCSSPPRQACATSDPAGRTQDPDIPGKRPSFEYPCSGGGWAR